MSEPQGSKTSTITALLMRVLTMILLLASLIVFSTDTATFRAILSLEEVTIRFKHIYAYRYAVSTIVIGMAYTLLQLPFAIHIVSSRKRLVNHAGLLYFDFFADKVILCLLGTGVGATFGSTFDLKYNLDALDDILQRLGYETLAIIRPKLDNFFNMAYLSASLLLLAFICAGVSSVMSSLALSKKE